MWFSGCAALAETPVCWGSCAYPPQGVANDCAPSEQADANKITPDRMSIRLLYTYSRFGALYPR
jgi:hypothetical protein